jgi:hypothetical protein
MAKADIYGGDWVEGVDCHSENITCPHCLEVDEERTDYPMGLNHDGDKAVFTCSECGKDSTVWLCVEYTFQTSKEVK